MRQIEENMVNAINERHNYTEGNTKVRFHAEGYSVSLHDNVIYFVRNGRHSFTLSGWNTPTTRSRLKALGVEVKQRNFAPLYKGKEINVNKWYNV